MILGGRTLAAGRHRGLDIAALLIGRLASEYPRSVHTRQLLAKQPWSSDTMGGSVSGGDISDPTGEAASQKALEDLDEMHALAQMIVVCTNKLDEYVRRTPTLTGPDDSLRCNCANMKGSADWGRPECDANADTRSGLCRPCYKRQWQWHVDHGLPSPAAGIGGHDDVRGAA